MSDTLAFLRTNPVIIAILAGMAITTLVLGFIAFLMIRAGLSIRPVVFLAVFMAIVAGPQVAFHFSMAMGWIPKRDLVWIGKKDRGAVFGYRENEAKTEVRDGIFVHARELFGPDADTSLISDVRRLPALMNAEAAQMAIVPPAGSIVVGKFANPAFAQAAGMLYVGQATGKASGPGSDGMWTVQRPVGDWLKGVAAGRTLIFASGATEAEASERLNATGAFAANDSDPGVTQEAKEFWLYQPRALIALALVMLVLSVGWFFRGSSWAATTEPKPGVTVQSAEEVRRRLLAVNNLDVPYTVREDGRNRFIVSYRFGDAKWVDLARAHGMSRTHRIIMELDESSHSVRPTEQASRLDWSAGLDGGSVQWSTGPASFSSRRSTRRCSGCRSARTARSRPT